MKVQDTITVTIMSPSTVVYEGTALSLSASNSEGIFDIMPDHARFMTLVAAVPITVYELDGSNRVFTFDTAVLFFQDNAAKIYTHQAV